jgi:hypothetical protein
MELRIIPPTIRCYPKRLSLTSFLSAIDQPLATSFRSAKKPLGGWNGCCANWLILG